MPSERSASRLALRAASPLSVSTLLASIAGTLRRVALQFIDDLADYYGEIMYPSFFEKIDPMDGPALRETPYHREAIDNRHWSERYRPSETSPQWGELTSTSEVAAPKPWYAPIVSAVAWLRERIRWAEERRRAVQALERLDDHALNDIGITRDQIESVTGRWRD
jgi:uncharacterized protein YjiS (DUF1127 family)